LGAHASAAGIQQRREHATAGFAALAFATLIAAVFLTSTAGGGVVV
jgi:hypothetical protein